MIICRELRLKQIKKEGRAQKLIDMSDLSEENMRFLLLTIGTLCKKSGRE